MRHARLQRFGRVTTVAAGLVCLAFVGATLAFADTVAADTDLVTAGNQMSTDLGVVAPGATLTVPVRFQLVCKGTEHVAQGATVSLAYDSGQAPAGGAITPVADGSIGPVPAWPVDGNGCFTPPQVVSTGTPASVRLTAPTLGGAYEYDLAFVPAVSDGDTAAITSPMVFAAFTLTVVSNTPPQLELPADVTVEGNATGGAVVAFDAVAADAEDDPAPTPTCDPASGSLFPLGSTTVACSVTDSGGLSASGSFAVTVVDTTAPDLTGVPPDLVVATTDPSGAAVSWPTPAATDIVDPAPVVTCDPAPGAWFPVGRTTVVCRATDASGNVAEAAFDVTVDLYAAAFDAPLGPTNSLGLNGNRSLPVKAQIWLNGVRQTSGDVRVDVAACSGGPVRASTPLSWTDASGGRWVGKLDLSGLADGCYRATLWLDGQPAGGFDLQAAQGSARSTSKH